MAKKNSKKSYTGKSYTVNNGKNKKPDNKTVRASTKTQSQKLQKTIALTDTSGVDGYFRPEVAVSRWKQGYEVFMSNFMKMLGLNFMMLLFLLPTFVLLFFRTTTIYGNAASSPFSANMGVGYFPFASLLGLEEKIIYSANFTFFMWLPAAAFVLGVGLSGGMYVMRNLCWGENPPVFKTFFRGVKKNIFPVLASSVIYSIILSAAALTISRIDCSVALSGSTWYFVIFKILLYAVIVFASLIFLAMTSISVTYTGNYFSQLKNSCIFTLALLPLNIFFAVFALLPFALLFLGSNALSLALILILFLGVSFTMLVWTVYSQWIYDKFINGRVKTYEASAEEIAKHNSREKEKVVAGEDEGYREVGKLKSIMDGVTPVTDYDVTLSDLDEVYTRDDIDALEKSKDQL